MLITLYTFIYNILGCNNNEFACADGSCIKLGQVCDFKPDCTNAEDEFCGTVSKPYHILYLLHLVFCLINLYVVQKGNVSF
jgi:uncharacterized membrane protein YadS